MTQPTANQKTGRQATASLRMTMLALAALSAAPAALASEADAAGEDQLTTENITGEQARQAAEKVAAPAEVLDPEGQAMNVRPAEAMPQGPVMGPDAGETNYYGPPLPKAKKGELPVIGWNEPPAYVPPALEEAVNLVGSNYPSAKAARAALKAAASDVKSAKWLRFPTIEGNVAYLDNNSSPEPQVVVTAPIWSGGRIGANIRRSKALEDVSSASYIETVQDLALTTTQAYFEIVRLTRSESLLADSLKEHLRLVDTMERRVQQEISPVADLELARSRAAQIEQQYTVVKSQRRTTLRVLAELIADPSYDLGPIPYYDADVDLKDRDSLEEQAVAYDPTLHRLYAETNVARADLDTREASLLPQVSAQYSYDDVFKSRVGVVVRSQTTGGLSQFSDVNSARLRIDSSLENIRVAEQQLRRDIEAAIIQYESAKERAVISGSAATTATRVSASYMRQFIAGRRSWLDVMNALREAVSAQIGRSDAEVTAMATSTVLLLRSGRWHPIFYDPGSVNADAE